MEKEIKNLREQFKKSLTALKTRKELLIIENEYTGRKGIVAQMLKRITSLTPEERPRAGQLLNQIKKEISSKYNRVISQNDAESILSNGYIKIKGSIEEQSVKIVNDILDEYMNSIKKFIINNNHDIDTIFIDSVLKQADISNVLKNLHIPGSIELLH